MIDHLTATIFIVVVLLGVAYDIWTLAVRGYETTLSATLLKIAKAYPIVPFIAGILIGHTLWVNSAGICP